MRVSASLRKPILAFALLAALGACESSEERAARHYESGVELAEAGDPTRALVELRNVFKLDPDHEEARLLYARLLNQTSARGDAYKQYLRLVQQFPNNIEALSEFSALAVANTDWPNARKYLPRALEAAPDDLTLKGLKSAVDYQQGIEEDNADLRAEALKQAEIVLAQDDTQIPPLQVRIDALLRAEDGAAALREVERAITLQPDDLNYHELKLTLLDEMGQSDDVGAHLEEIYRQFPENERIRQRLIRWYLEAEKLDEAEAFLRGEVERADPADRDEALATVVEFLRVTQGPNAAMAEVDRLIEAGENQDLFRSLRAGLMLQEGRIDEAVALLREITESAEPSQQTDRIRITLARVLESQGDQVGARALIEEVLTQDPSNVGALKMRAGWLIETDKTGEAIAALRVALDQEPRDVETLALMAEAHEREGNYQLAGERLSLAVESSNYTPETATNYARFLVQRDQPDQAEQVLAASLRRNPGAYPLLIEMGQLFLRTQDWRRVEEIATRLAQFQNPEAQQTALGLRTAALQGQNRLDETNAYLQEMLDTGAAGPQAAALVIQNMLRENKIDEAKAYLEAQLEREPESVEYRFLQAGLDLATGNEAAAIATYRELIEASPEMPRFHQALALALLDQGKEDEADAVIAAGIEATGEPSLRLMQANRAEARGDLAGAIEIYEGLYAEDSSNLLVANNLASLLSTTDESPEALERAQVIARRLRDTEIPPLQDTYGWIALRRGDVEEALAYLEPAAAGMPDHPETQLHLGLAYIEAGRRDEAREVLERARELAPADSPVAKAVETARDRLETSDSTAPSAPSENAPSDDASAQ